MRALVLISDAFGGHGGIAKFNRDLLTALCRYPDTQEIVAIPRVMPNSPGLLPDKLHFVTEGLGSKAGYLKTMMRQLWRRRGKYDVIVCGHINLLPFALIAKKMTGAKIALIIHGIDAWTPITRKATLYAMKQVDYVISVSQLTLERFIDWSKLRNRKNFVLPNSFEPGLFTPGSKPTYLSKRYRLDGKRIIMTLGRLAGKDRYKGFDEVLDALPALLREQPNLVYMIVGDGKDKERLMDKVIDMGLSQHVVFTGLISEEEKADHYRLADAFAMPSRGEGFGIVLLEAMACGLPVLASKIDGSREALLNGELGTLVDPRDSREIVNGLLELIHQPVGRVPERLSYFSFQNYEQRLHSILNELA